MRLFSDVASGVADPHLSRALHLAEKARGATAPNPLVGCVIVRDGIIVGEGFHPRAGEPHAEVFALAAAGDRARGASAYVTLEPCNHHGRTPPCVDALLESGVSRVVIGMADPSAEAAGGARRLVAAGVEVALADDDGPFKEINAGWLTRLTLGRPRVTVKLGLTFDGRLAFERGMRSAITGRDGAQVTRRLRAAADAVMVGAHTVVSDDPALTVRDERGVLAERQPLRVVVAGGAMPPGDARVFTDHAAPTLLVVPRSLGDAGEGLAALRGEGVLVDVTGGDGSVKDVLRELARRGVNDVLVEPGARLFSAMWAEGVVDEIVTVTAGGVGGRDALGFFEGDGEHENGELFTRFRPLEAGIVGDVAVVVWRLHQCKE